MFGQIYKMTKCESSSKQSTLRMQHVPAVDISSQHLEDITAVGIDSAARYMMSASRENKLVLYDLTGAVVHTVDTKQNGLYNACVSACGRYVAACGFTSVVNVWHVEWDKARNAVKAVKRAFELTVSTRG